MKPVSLRLQAFGSYAEELHVDFARLARHGIFSISGPTGAGKSTIFDALVYALYDDLPGFRVDGNVRSQFADPWTPTSVSLDFVVHGERWRVVRRPAQLLPSGGRGKQVPRGKEGSRGKEAVRAEEVPLREKKSEAVLGRVGDDGELLPGTVVTRKSVVKDRIDTLVGLAKDQFEQVALIPQGRFEEVLKADTHKRAPLLQRLFPVEVFTRVTEHLKSIAADRQRALEEAERSYGALVERLEDAFGSAIAQLPAEVRTALFEGREGEDAGDAGDGEPGGRRVLRVELLEHDVGVLRESVRRVDELVGASASRAESARARLGDVRRAVAEWDRWQEELILSASFEAEERVDAQELAVLERARRLSDLCGALGQWQEATCQLGTLEPELAGLVDAIESAWPSDLDAAAWAGAQADAYAAGLLAERLASDARRLDAETARFVRLVEAGHLLEAGRASLGERRIELAERALKLGAEEQATDLVTDEVQTLRAEASGLDAQTAALAALEREHQIASRRATALADVDRLGAELAETMAAAARSAELADAVRASWRDGVAGRLARLLAEGEPCPTCGALEHPAPAEWHGGGADDAELEAAERAREDAFRVRGDAEKRAAEARGVVDALCESRSLDAVEADLLACREALRVVRDAEERLAVVAAEERRRRSALVEARKQLAADDRGLETDDARLGADVSAHARAVEEFVADYGQFESPAAGAEARAGLAAGLERLAGLLREAQAARDALRHLGAVLEPVARELDERDPGGLLACVMEPVELGARAAALEDRRSRREDVRRRIAEYEARSGLVAGDVAAEVVVRPDAESAEALAKAAASEHVALVERRGVLADRVAVLASGPAEVADAAAAVDAARVALEQAKTVADRCAGVGGGPGAVRLSLENWVLADYLRQVLVQANHRLDAMTEGRFSLELCDGVTDGRKQWGLDLAVFDANTGQVRPATTLSGGETFMAALSLALGLADVVSGGSNREVGALFVDEGFGSLDPQSLDAVIDVLRSLEDGGRTVGVISHVRELQQALPSGITVEPSPRGSVAQVHYPPG